MVISSITIAWFFLYQNTTKKDLPISKKELISLKNIAYQSCKGAKVFNNLVQKNKITQSNYNDLQKYLTLLVNEQINLKINNKITDQEVISCN